MGSQNNWTGSPWPLEGGAVPGSLIQAVPSLLCVRSWQVHGLRPRLVLAPRGSHLRQLQAPALREFLPQGGEKALL